MRTHWLSGVFLGAAACSSAFADASRIPVDAEGNRAWSWSMPVQASNQLPPIVDRGTPAWTSFGPGGGDGQAVAASPTQPGVVVVGITNSFGAGAIYRSTNSGASWTKINSTGSRGINDLKFAIDGTGYAATSDGLFKSTDHGASWTEVTLPTEPATLVASIAVSPTSADTLWIGMSQYFDGSQSQFVLSTINGGVNWNNISPPSDPAKGITALAVNPADTTQIIAGFAGNFGIGGEVWATTDGGTIWNDRTAGLPANLVNDIQIVGGQTYLVGGQDFGSQFIGLYTSPDLGANWTERSADWPSRAVNTVSVDAANPQVIYVGTSRAGLGKSTDGGTTFNFNLGGTGTLPVNDVELAGASVYLGMGSVALYKSADSGATFNLSAAGIRELNVTAFAVSPANPNHLAIAYNGSNDGGIFESTDGGQSFTFSQAPLPRWTWLEFGPDGTLYGTHDGPLGRADDGVWRRETSGSWTGFGPGSPSQLDTEGRVISVSSSNPSVIYFGGSEGFFGGWDAVLYTYNLSGSGTWEKQYESLIPSERVNAIQPLGGGAGGGGPTVVASVVNFGQEDGSAGGIFRSTDLGDNWVRSETGYPATWHGWSLGYRAAQPDVVYVSSSQNTGSFPAAIYKSADGGVSWTAQGSNDTFRSFVVDPNNTSTLYGVEVFSSTVYRSTDDGATFQPYTNGLPSGSGVNQIFVGGIWQPRLYATAGSGAFVTNLPAPCIGDFNGQGGTTVQDIFDFLAAYFSNAPRADVNSAGGVTVQDIFDFLAAYFAGCA